MSGQRPTQASRPATGAATGPPTLRNGDDADDGVVRRLAREDRHADRRPRDARPQPAGVTASADAVEQVRRSITDIKHDVRMLKVVLDKQGMAIDRIAATLAELAGTEEE